MPFPNQFYPRLYLFLRPCGVDGRLAYSTKDGGDDPPIHLIFSSIHIQISQFLVHVPLIAAAAAELTVYTTYHYYTTPCLHPKGD